MSGVIPGHSVSYTTTNSSLGGRPILAGRDHRQQSFTNQVQVFSGKYAQRSFSGYPSYPSVDFTARGGPPFGNVQRPPHHQYHQGYNGSGVAANAVNPPPSSVPIGSSRPTPLEQFNRFDRPPPPFDGAYAPRNGLLPPTAANNDQSPVQSFVAGRGGELSYPHPPRFPNSTYYARPIEDRQYPVLPSNASNYQEEIGVAASAAANNNSSQCANRDSQSLPVLVLWDVENVQVPKNIPVAQAIFAVRAYIQRIMADRLWFETDFAVACDVFRQSTRRIDEMNDAQITVIHVNSMSKNAADMKLKVYMHKFATMFSQQAACIVLISGDVNFAPSLHLARHHAKLQVVLLHNQLTPAALLETAHFADDFYRVVTTMPWLEGPASVWAGGPAQIQRPLRKQSNHLLVANLPENADLGTVSRRLHKMSSNTGGRVIEIRGSLALMKFPSSQNAFRAFSRLEERDVLGQKIRVHLVDDPKNGRKTVASLGRPSDEVSSSSARLEALSAGEIGHSTTSSDDASDVPCVLEGRPTTGRRQLTSTFNSCCTTEALDGAAASSPGCGTSVSEDSPDDSSCSSQLPFNLSYDRGDDSVLCGYANDTATEEALGKRSLLNYLLANIDGSYVGPPLPLPQPQTHKSSPASLNGVTLNNSRDVHKSGKKAMKDPSRKKHSGEPHLKANQDGGCLLSVAGRMFQEQFLQKTTICAEIKDRHRLTDVPMDSRTRSHDQTSDSRGTPRSEVNCSKRSFEKRRKSNKHTYDLHDYTRFERSLLILVYFIREILKEQHVSTVNNADQIIDQAENVVRLDDVFAEDIHHLLAGKFPPGSAGEDGRLVDIGKLLVLVLMEKRAKAENINVSHFTAEAYLGHNRAALKSAKSLLKISSSNVYIPKALEVLQAGCRVDCVQKLLQQFADMLLVTTLSDVRQSAKAFISLDDFPLNELLQQWILQTVAHQDVFRVLDPFRALLRCHRLPKTVNTLKCEDDVEPTFSLRRAVELGGPDVIPVLAHFMTSSAPVTLAELQNRFLKKEKRPLPPAVLHTLRDLGAIQIACINQEPNKVTPNVYFYLDGACRSARTLIRLMNRAPYSVYQLTSPNVVATYNHGQISLSFLLKQAKLGSLLADETSVTKWFADFGDFFEKIASNVWTSPSSSSGADRSGYRLRERVIIVKAPNLEKRSPPINKTSTTNLTAAATAAAASQRRPYLISCVDLQRELCSGVNVCAERQRSQQRSRRNLRLAAIFPIP